MPCDVQGLNSVFQFKGERLDRVVGSGDERQIEAICRDCDFLIRYRDSLPCHCGPGRHGGLAEAVARLIRGDVAGYTDWSQLASALELICRVVAGEGMRVSCVDWHLLGLCEPPVWQRLCMNRNTATVPRIGWVPYAEVAQTMARLKALTAGRPKPTHPDCRHPMLVLDPAFDGLSDIPGCDVLVFRFC